MRNLQEMGLPAVFRSLQPQLLSAGLNTRLREHWPPLTDRPDPEDPGVTAQFDLELFSFAES
jgi:hypothetical protein